MRPSAFLKWARVNPVGFLLCLVLTTACAVGSYLVLFLFYSNQGLMTGLSEAVEQAAPDYFAVYNYAPRGDPMTVAWDGLTADELAALAAELGDAARVAGFTAAMWANQPSIVVGSQAPASDSESHLYYIGVTPSYFGIRGLRLAEGRLMAEGSPGECVVGAGVTRLAPAKDGHHSFPPRMPSRLPLVGTLASTEGHPVPALAGSMQFDVPTDMCVFTSPDGVPSLTAGGGGLAITTPPTGLFALVQPLSDNPGEIVDRAVDWVSALYPNHEIFVASEGSGRAVLQGAQRRMEVYYSLITVAFVLMAAMMMVNLVAYDAVRNWRSVAIRRAVGATRAQIWNGLMGKPLAACLAGATVGAALCAISGRAVAARIGLPWATGWASPIVVGLFGLLGLLSTGLGSLRALGTSPRSAFGGPRLFFRRRPLDVRRILAAVAMSIAVGGLVLVIGSGRAGNAYLTAFLRAGGERTIVVRPTSIDDPGLEKALADLQSRLGSDYRIALQRPVISAVAVNSGSMAQTVSLFSTRGDFVAVRGFNLSHALPGVGGSLGGGRIYMGSILARELLGGESEALGASLLIEGKRFTVAGVLAKRPPSLIDPVVDRDLCLIVSMDDAHGLPSYEVQTTRAEIWLVAPGTRALGEIASEIRQLLGGASGLTVEPLIAEVATLRQARRASDAALVAVALAGLILAGLGVTAFFLSLAAEQTRSNAIRRAVGATSRRIQAAMLLQSAKLGAAAGLVGVVLGQCAIRYVCLRQGWPDSTDPYLLVFVLAASTALALAAAYLPVIRLARTALAHALRREE